MTDSYRRDRHTQGPNRYTARMLARTQEGKCAICNEEDYLLLDHNHKTQTTRGLFFRDNVTFLSEAIRYLLLRDDLPLFHIHVLIKNLDELTSLIERGEMYE